MIMKRIFLFHLLLFVIATKALSQNTDGALQKSPTCFFVSHVAPASNKKQVSKTFCVGNKIKVNLVDDQIIKGTLDRISRDNTIIVNGIEAKAIQSFQKAGVDTGTAILGGLLTVGGAALILHGTNPNTDLDTGPGQAIVGIVSTICGIIILTSHDKFEIEKDDIWTYNH